MGSSSASHPVDVGTQAEATVLAALVCAGYRVLTPYGANHRYDLAIDHEGILVRVQCKHGRLRDGRVMFNTLSVRSNTRIARRSGYRGAADLFLVACPATSKVYCVPVEATTQSVATLRVEPTRNGQAIGVRWAVDHELEAALPRALAGLRARASRVESAAPASPPL